MSRRPPPVRLLWDEDLSPKVPEALRVLGFRTIWPGQEPAPPRGSSDRTLVDYALTSNQVIVTSNHDMMTLCDEQGQRFVWLDPRARQLTRTDQVLIVFTQITRWNEILNEDPAACIKAMRTTCTPIRSGDAARLALNRMRAIERRKRKKAS